MATITIDEIRRFLLQTGRADILEANGGGRIQFLEILFSDPDDGKRPVIDEEMANQTISAEATGSTCVIQFDRCGYLRSIDFS